MWNQFFFRYIIEEPKSSVKVFLSWKIKKKYLRFNAIKKNIHGKNTDAKSSSF